MAKRKRTWYVEESQATAIELEALRTHYGNESQLIRHLIDLGFKQLRLEKKKK